MYVDPFLLGVCAALFVAFLGILVLAIRKGR